MLILRCLLLAGIGLGLVGCYPPPPPEHRVTVVCTKNWRGERVCTQYVSKH